MHFGGGDQAKLEVYWKVLELEAIDQMGGAEEAATALIG